MSCRARNPLSETAKHVDSLWERECSEVEDGTSCEPPVRRFTNGDMKLLAPLAYAAFADTVDSAPLEQWTRKISSIVNGRYGAFLPTASFVAETPSGQLTGVVLATDFPLYQAPVIALIAVVPSAQGRGVGSYLLLRCIDALAAEGFAVCRARISFGNEASQRLFRKIRFERR